MRSIRTPATVTAVLLALTGAVGPAQARSAPAPDGQVARRQPGPVPIKIVSPATPERVEVFTGSTLAGFRPPSEQALATLAAAEQLAERHPADLAPPYSNGDQVVLKPTTAKGATLVAGLAGAHRRTLAAAAPAVRARNSAATLKKIADQVVELGPAKLPGGPGSYGSFIDADRNRVVITAGSVTDRFRVALAARYGSDKVAIQHSPLIAGLRPAAAPDGRRNDNNPFEGGSLITVRNRSFSCTDAFPWYDPGRYGYAVLTAGHCTALTGMASSIYTGRAWLGIVRKDLWGPRGSVSVGGRYRGDVSLVEVKNGAKVIGYVHTGGPTSTSSRKVRGMPSRRIRKGDKYCTGGARTGSICDWTVDVPNYSHRYKDGTIFRYGYRSDTNWWTCAKLGDSGGPDYVISGGKVVPKGILHGVSNIGPTCLEVGTDIWDAYYGLPGWLVKG